MCREPGNRGDGRGIGQAHLHGRLIVFQLGVVPGKQTIRRPCSACLQPLLLGIGNRRDKDAWWAYDPATRRSRPPPTSIIRALISTRSSHLLPSLELSWTLRIRRQSLKAMQLKAARGISTNHPWGWAGRGCLIFYCRRTGRENNSFVCAIRIRGAHRAGVGGEEGWLRLSCS